MPPGVRQLPPSLLPGSGSRSPASQPPSAGAPHSQSPTDIADSSAHQSPWTNPRTPGADNNTYQEQPDARVGRSQEPGQNNRDGSGDVDRSRQNGGQGASKSPGASARVCKKCGEPLLGQFVRALGATYHLECYQCQVSIGASVDLTTSEGSGTN